MSLSDAVGQPRFHHQWRPDRVIYETPGFSPDTLAKLRAMGHENLLPYTFGRGIGDANSALPRRGRLLRHVGPTQRRRRGGRGFRSCGIWNAEGALNREP